MHSTTTITACDWVFETHCIRARCPGPGGQVQSCGIQQAWAWWEGGTQPAGSSAGVSGCPCQELRGPISEKLRPHPCMLISLSEEPRSRASAGVHCHGDSSSHTTLPEQVDQLEGTQCRGSMTFTLRQWLQSEEAKRLTHSVQCMFTYIW